MYELHKGEVCEGKWGWGKEGKGRRGEGGGVSREGENKTTTDSCRGTCDSQALSRYYITF